MTETQLIALMAASIYGARRADDPTLYTHADAVDEAIKVFRATNNARPSRRNPALRDDDDVPVLRTEEGWGTVES